MPVYITPDGEKYEFPDQLTQDHQDWIRQFKAVELGPDGKPVPAVLPDMLRSTMGGITEGAFRAPLIGGDIVNLAGTLVNKARPGTIPEETLGRFGSQGWIDAFRGSPADKATGELLFYEPKTTPGRYAKAASSAVSGAVTTGGMGGLASTVRGTGSLSQALAAAGRPSSSLINAASGLAGEFGTQVSGNPLVGMAAGMATSTAGNAIRQAVSPNFREGLHDATRDMKPGDWKSASDSLDDFRRSGSTTFTLADLPELQARIGGQARDITNTSGGELLKDKFSLQNRRGIVQPDGTLTGDIPRLIQGAVDVVPPVSDHRALAIILAKKAEGAVDAAAAPVYTARDGGLAGLGNVDPNALLQATNQQVRQRLIQGQNQGAGMQAALTKAEEALLGRDATRTPQITNVVPPVLNVQSLSQNVKGVRKIPSSDTNNPSAGISRYQGMAAGEAAERALDQATGGGFGQVMSQYRSSLENIVDPMKRGLPGTLQTAKNADTLIERLREVPKDKLLGELNTAGVTPDEAKQLARIVGERLMPLPDATKAMGTPNLELRRVFDQLLEYADPSLKATAARKLKVADALSRLDAEHSADSTQRVTMQKGPMDWLTPFSTAGFRNRLSTGRKEARAMSELLANPTPENLEALRRMSLLDPRAKKFMDWYTSWGGAAASSGGRE